MRIFLNGEARDIATGSSLGVLLDAANYRQRRVAVEVNRVIVPKSRHDEHVLRDGDRVEVVQAMGGG